MVAVHRHRTKIKIHSSLHLLTRECNFIITGLNLNMVLKVIFRVWNVNDEKNYSYLTTILMAKNLCNYKLVPSLLSFNFEKTLNSSCSFFTDAKWANYMFKVNNRNNKIRCKICSKAWKAFTKTNESPRRRRSSVFIVKFEYISHLALVFLLLTLSR